jgi:licheninase
MLATQKNYGASYWPDNGEIDVMEHVGYDRDVVHASAHTKAYHHSINTQKTARIKVDSACSGFNVYAVEWTPEEIRWYVNDKQYFKFANERLHSGLQTMAFRQAFSPAFEPSSGRKLGRRAGRRRVNLASADGS